MLNDLPYEFKVIGWQETSRETITKIIQAYKNNKELKFIYISQEGEITLKENQLKNIFLGKQPEKIDLQLRLIFEIKKELKSKELIGKIENLDITDINNPTLKVFKP
mgnify:CR=1 FL=1